MLIYGYKGHLVICTYYDLTCTYYDVKCTYYDVMCIVL